MVLLQVDENMRKNVDTKLRKNEEDLKFIIVIDDFFMHDLLVRRKLT